MSLEIDDQKNEGLKLPEDPQKKEEPKKEPKGKDEQFAELRASRDELQAKLDELQGNAIPITKIKETFGDDLGDDPLQYFDSLKAKAEQASVLEEDYKKVKTKLRDIDIRNSDEYKTEYRKPWEEANNDLGGLIANLDADDEVAHPEMVQSFGQTLIGKLDEITDITKLKPYLNQFAKLYEERTGETYQRPAAQEVMSTIRRLQRIAVKERDAVENWEETKKQRQADEQARQEAEAQQQRQNSIELNRKAAIKTMSEFWSTTGKTYHDQDTVQNAYTAVFDQLTGSETPEFNDLLGGMAKGQLYDAALKRIEELESELKAVAPSRGRRMTISSSAGKTTPKSEESHAGGATGTAADFER